MTTKTRPATRHEFAVAVFEQGYAFPLEPEHWNRIARETGYLPPEPPATDVSEERAAAEAAVTSANEHWRAAREQLLAAERAAGRDTSVLITARGEQVIAEAPAAVSDLHEHELEQARAEMRAVEHEHQRAVDNRIAVLAGEGPRRPRGRLRRALGATW